ncbi:TPA: TetR/AcrR family transcriptional regulator [Pseudomonas aeruginosa]|uniref:TetR/AcrR family transcriptional regulator n=1 Tax=Pseudomonas aeruginosa TaxID=287 RepID=UPI000512F483|nr:TetR/AcrR family transcriptional regulator [Pseudomonas aeruginosa]KHE57315.1 hypothetical protein D480_0224910 [Pseudomonas aeruginosa]KSP86056.1 hypothetical protein APB20_08495 [Pseudomonas aeruginosa]MBX6718739.1 TetR/AcrR family transcriptional regulator [Pseudomonas aeruginosa]MBX6874735.1 TetR/AcrR family transcriptional regulator [Pseudomonas aeruginosa]WHV52062.1 TetR/AcrR family transcriptional regulator [Pseudomonas aeruginosa]
MRYSSEQKAETRSRLLSSAAKATKRAGLVSASVDAIAAAAGITGAGVYHHFPSKQDLFAAVVAQELESSLLTRLSRSPDFDIDELLTGLGQYLSAEHLRNVEGGCPVPAMCVDIAHADEPVKQGFETWMEELHRSWAEVLGSSSLARGAISQCIGALLIARMMSGEELQQQVLHENLLDLRDRL